jgi:hypothetical protein
MPYPVSPIRRLAFGMLLVALSIVSPLALAQQSQDPFQPAKDAYNKAKQELQSLRTQSKPSQATESQAAQAPTPAPSHSGAPAAGAYEGLVTSDAPSTPPVRGLEKAPPDIGGIRLGMSPEEAHSALLKRYPGRKIDVNQYEIYTPNAGGTPAAKVLESFSIGFNELVTPEDRIHVMFTPPPGKPVVWSVTRNLFKQNIYRANALASLREKYGRESLARRGDGTDNRATDDSEVKSMTWIFDRQGHPGATPPGGGVDALNACQQRANGQSMFTYDNILRAGHNEAQMASDLAISPWCSSSGIIVWADIPPGPIIGTLMVQAIDNPTVESAMRAEGEWLRKLAAARAQQAIDASKKSKPDL